VAPQRRPLKEAFNLNDNSSDEEVDKQKSASGTAGQKNWEIEDLFEFDIDRLVGVARSTAWGVAGDLSKGGDGTAAEGNAKEGNTKEVNVKEVNFKEGNVKDAEEQTPGGSELEQLRQQCATKDHEIKRLRRVVCELLVWAQHTKSGSAAFNFGAGTPAVTKMRSEAPEFVPLGISWSIPEQQPADGTSDLQDKQSMQSLPPSGQTSALLTPWPSPSPHAAVTAAPSSQGQIVNALDNSIQPARMPQPPTYPPRLASESDIERIGGLLGLQNTQPPSPTAQPFNMLATQPGPQTASNFDHATLGASSSQGQVGLGALTQGQNGTAPPTGAPVYDVKPVGLLSSGVAGNLTNPPVGSHASPLLGTNFPGKGRGRRGKSRRARRSHSMMPTTDATWRGQESGQPEINYSTFQW